MAENTAKKARGSAIVVVKFVSLGGLEPLIPEETAALDDYQEKMTEEIKEGCTVLILQTQEKAQKLLALTGKNKKAGPRDSSPLLICNNQVLS